MKNLKISHKLSLVVSIILIAGLGCMCLLSNITMTDTMEKSTYDRMQETAQDRCELIQNYLQSAETYLKGYIYGTELTTALENPTDENLAAAQSYTISYAKINDNLENIYLSDMNSVVLASMVTAPIGMQLRKGEDLQNLLDQVFKTSDVYNIGVIKSKSTDAQVLSMYCPIYDENGTPIGFAGMALKAEDLLDTLDSLEFVNLKNCRYEILDLNNNTYIYCNDAAQNGCEITEEATLKLIEQVQSKNAATESKGTYKNSTTGNHETTVYNYIESRGWLFLVIAENKELYASINELSIKFIIICVIVCLLGTFSVQIVARLIAKDLKNLSLVLTDIGNLNLTQESALAPYKGRKDEAGIIADAMHHLVEAVSRIILQLKQDSSTLNQASMELDETFERSIESVNMVDRAVQDIANGAGSQAEDTQRASDNIRKIGDMIETISIEMKTLEDNSAALKNASEMGEETFVQLQSINQQTEESVRTIFHQTNTTNDSVVEIQKAVSFISSIAEETSLLSLNASIEAARAGEQGRGFSVVATQIKQLAEQSNTAASKINEIITALIKDSQQAVQTVEEVKNNIGQQSEQVQKTLMIFDNMKDKLDLSIEEINHITQQTEEMNHSRREVVDVVSNLSAISEQNAASTQETSASLTEVNSMLETVKGSGAKISEIAAKIDKNIGAFWIKE